MSHLPQTDRLYFREFTLEYARVLYEMHQDSAVNQYIMDPIPWDSVKRVEEILRQHIIPQYAHKIGRWAVHLKSNGAFIGWCGLKDTDGEIDLGYRFMQQYWGKGYATEAASAVLKYGIENGYSNIVGRAAVANEASVAVLRKIGLSFVSYYKDGEVESVKFAMFPDAH